MDSNGPDSYSAQFGTNGQPEPPGDGHQWTESGSGSRHDLTPASSRIRLIPLSHEVPGRLGTVACQHPDGHDYLVAVEVEHAVGGPDLAETLVFVLERLYDRLRMSTRNPHALTGSPVLGQKRDDPDPAEDGDHPFGSLWHTDRSWIADAARRFVEERIPAPLRGDVTAWSVRIYPHDGGPNADGSAVTHRSGKQRRYDEPEEGFPYGIPGYTQALAELEGYRRSRANQVRDQAKQQALWSARVQRDIGSWSPPGAPEPWVGALRVAEAGLGQHALVVSESLSEPSWTIAALAVSLYLVSAETGLSPQEVRRDQMPAEETRHWHDSSAIAARLSALGHDLCDGGDPVAACWQVLAYDYREPDAREDPIAAQIYDEDSTALSGTRFNLAMADLMRFWPRLWPDGTVTLLEQVPIPAQQS